MWLLGIGVGTSEDQKHCPSRGIADIAISRRVIAVSS
jgi:hypothetical protein